MLITIISITGCINNNEKDRESFVTYNLTIKTNDTFTICVPFLDIDEISENELLSKINVDNRNVEYSIVVIDENEEIYENLTNKSKNNYKALKVIGNGDTNIRLKINGEYSGKLTLVLINKTYSFGTYIHKSNFNQTVSICLSCIIQTAHSDKHWNDSKNYNNLNEGWNTIRLDFWGGIE